MIHYDIILSEKQKVLELVISQFLLSFLLIRVESRLGGSTHV